MTSEIIFEPRTAEDVLNEKNATLAARYTMLLRLLRPSIASLMHCEEEHIGIELDERIEADLAKKANK